MAVMSVFATFGLTGVAQAAPVEIAVNGGFETGDFTGWELFPGTGGAAQQQIVTTNPSSGTYAARLTENNPAANIIKQANLFPGQWTEGQAIQISLDYRGTTAAGGLMFVELFNELDGGGVGPGSGIIGGPLFGGPTADDWQTFTTTAFAGPITDGGITLQLAVICGADPNCVADFYIDNVSIVADVVPIPAAVWLFGSALLGMGGLSRKLRAKAS